MEDCLEVPIVSGKGTVLYHKTVKNIYFSGYNK